VSCKHSLATASACSFSHNKGCCVFVDDGATALLQDECKCAGSNGGGWQAKGKGSVLVGVRTEADKRSVAEVAGGKIKIV